MLNRKSASILPGVCFIALLCLNPAPSSIAYPQSSDRNSPTPLNTNPFNASIRAQDNGSYFYTFTAGPGSLKISVPVRTNGNVSQIFVELYDGANSLLTSFDATSSGVIQQREVVLNGKDRLVLKITGLRMNDSGSFTVKLTGRVFLNEAPAAGSTSIQKPPGDAHQKKDTTPPTIRITSPPVTRGQGAGAAASRITVIGDATDESGVSEVMVNGQPASLDSSGHFSAEVLLKVGENRIVVSATDTNRNQGEERFTIDRTGGAASPSQPDAGPPAKGKYYALLIAVQDYKDLGIKKLDNPVRDAEKLAEILTRNYTFDKQDVKLLKNATRGEIILAFEQLEKTLKPEDSLLIFYAGHGYWDDKTRQGYWIPVDVQRESRSNWLSNGEVRDSLRGIAVTHTLLITDACFSGGILKGRDIAMTAAIQQLSRMPSRTAMTSGAMTTVPDTSVFLEYLIKRLQENKETYKTAMELFSSLQSAVINNSPVVDKDGARPTPQYGVIQEAGDEGGDFIFVRRQ